VIQRILLGGLAAIFIGLGVATLLFGMQLPDFPQGITGKITDSLPPPNITPPRVQLDWKPRNNTPAQPPRTIEPAEPPSIPAGGSSGGSRGGRGGRSGGSSSGTSSGTQQDTREIVTLTVRVANVTELAGAQFEIRYGASTTLRTISEGPFLDNGSVSNAMLVNTALDAQAGQLVAIFRVAQGGVSGSGVLMTATFSTDNSGDITVATPVLSNNNAQTMPANTLSWIVQ